MYFVCLQYSFVTPVTSLVVVKPNSTRTVGTAIVQPEGNSLPSFFFVVGVKSLHVWNNVWNWHSWQPTKLYLY